METAVFHPEKMIFFFSEILTHTTAHFFHKKNDGLWLEFALFAR